MAATASRILDGILAAFGHSGHSKKPARFPMAEGLLGHPIASRRELFRKNGSMCAGILSATISPHGRKTGRIRAKSIAWSGTIDGLSRAFCFAPGRGGPRPSSGTHSWRTPSSASSRSIDLFFQSRTRGTASLQRGTHSWRDAVLGVRSLPSTSLYEFPDARDRVPPAGPHSWRDAVPGVRSLPSTSFFEFPDARDRVLQRGTHSWRDAVLGVRSLPSTSLFEFPDARDRVPPAGPHSWRDAVLGVRSLPSTSLFEFPDAEDRVPPAGPHSWRDAVPGVRCSRASSVCSHLALRVDFVSESSSVSVDATPGRP